MRDANRSIYLIVGCLILAAGTGAPAQDWPQWRGSNRDAVINGFVAPETWPESLTQNWRVIVGFGDAGPALVQGRLYVYTRQGDQEILMCLDAATGQEIWRQANAAANISGPARSHSGPRSTPTVARGRVVTLGAGGLLSCVDTSGRLLWRNDPFPGIVPPFFAAMSPLITGGAAIAHLGGPGNGALIAYDLESGNEIWRWSEDGPEYGSPVLMTVDGLTQVVTITERRIVGVSTIDGSLLWHLPFIPQRMDMNCTTPIIYGQIVIYTGQNRGTKAVRIERQGTSFTATELWSKDSVSTWFCTPVLKDNLIFGLSQQGNLFCLAALSGIQVWSDRAKHDRFGTILDTGSVLLAITPRSPLIVFDASEFRYNEVAKYKVAYTPVYAQPVVSGNAIYIKDRESLTKWTIQ